MQLNGKMFAIFCIVLVAIIAEAYFLIFGSTFFSNFHSFKPITDIQGKALKLGTVFEGKYSPTFIGQLNNVYQKNNQLYANITVDDKGDRISFVLFFDKQKYNKQLFVLNSQNVTYFNAASDNIKSKYLNFDQALSILPNYIGAIMAFSVVTAYPTNNLPITPLVTFLQKNILPCNQQLISLLKASNLQPLTCSASVSQAYVYENF